MDKRFLKEQNLLDAHKHFMSLCEWSYVPQYLSEDDDEEDNNEQNNDTNNPSDNNNALDNNFASDNTQNTGMNDINDNNMDDDSNDGNEMDNNMPNQSMDDNNMPDDNNSPLGNEPMGNENDADSFDNGMDNLDSEAEDEDVIDVDDLTNAQEKMNSKVNTVGQDLGQISDKIKELMSSLKKMEDMITKNNNEINRFKEEFILRNPTQVEKLNLRSLDSYPFNTQVKNYWDNKNKDLRRNYYGYADNDEPTSEEYEITNGDINNYNDKEIEDSFNIDDDLRLDLQKIFNY